jgi:isopentenyl-diphosphate delta-isomerase
VVPEQLKTNLYKKNYQRKGPMEDQLILVNLYDQAIGTAGKQEVHREGWLHRAFSVFLVYKDQMLIQKRAEHKYHSGGLWANTCCSHPRLGESLDTAVLRRLEEETGISCPVTPYFSFVYRAVFPNNVIEYELDHVFVGEYYGSFQANPEEASELKWISFEQLLEELRARPEKFAPWFISAAPQVIKDVLRNAL